MQREQPSTIGRYQLIEPLCQSYWGTLWDSHHTEEDRRALLRVVAADKLSEEERERAQRAAGAVWGLQHATVVAVNDVVTRGTALAIASEHVEGAPLSSVLATCREHGTPLGLEAAAQVALDMLAAVAFMHVRAPSLQKTTGFVYGGLTPDAFVVGSDGRTRMLEMGLPSVLRRCRALSQDPLRLGYDAAEVLQVGIDADGTADLFSVGVMLWEMVTNERLFPGNAFQVISKLRAGPLPRVDERGPLPIALVELIARALERDPRERFVSAGEMAAELRRSGIEPDGAGAIRVVGRLTRGRPRLDPPRRPPARAARPTPPPRSSALPGTRRSEHPPRSRRALPKFRSVPPPRDPAPSDAPTPVQSRPSAVAPPGHPATSAPSAAVSARPEAPPVAQPREEAPTPVDAASTARPAPMEARRRSGAGRLAIAAAGGAAIAVALTVVWMSGSDGPAPAPSAPPPSPLAEPEPTPTPRPETTSAEPDPPSPAPSAMASTEAVEAAPPVSAPPPRPSAPVGSWPPRPPPGKNTRLPDDI